MSRTLKPLQQRMTLEVGDKRERLEVEYPTDVYDALDTIIPALPHGK